MSYSKINTQLLEYSLAHGRCLLSTCKMNEEAISTFTILRRVYEVQGNGQKLLLHNKKIQLNLIQFIGM